MGVVKRQGIKNTISSYVGIVLGFVSLLVVQPQLLQPEEIGLARVLFAFSTLISTIIPFGITNVTIKYFPVFKNEKNGHHGFLGFILLFFLLGFLICGLGLVGFREFIIAQYRRESPLVTYYFNYVFPFSFFIALATVISNYLFALFKSTVSSYMNDVGMRLAYIGLIVIYYFRYITLEQFIAGYVGIYGLQTVLLFWYVTHIDTPSLKIDWQFLRKQNYREMLSFGLLLSLAGMAALGLKTLDSVFLGKFKSLNYVGIYAIAAFIPTVIETPLNALDRIMGARIAQAYNQGRIEEVKRVFYQSVKYLSVLGALLFVGVTTNITFLLNLIGKDFAQGVEVVYIISLGSLITMLGGSGNPLLIYTSKPWLGASMLIVLVVVTIGCNMLLIPVYGINGAAAATAISALLFTAGKTLLNYTRFGFQPYDLKTVKILFAAGICIGFHLILPEWSSDLLNILTQSVLLGGLYLVLIYFMKILPEFHHYLPWEKKTH